LPNVVTVAATSQALLRNVVTGGAEHAVTFFGATAGFQMIRNLLILKGRFLDTIDQQSRGKVCLITDELAGLVFPNEDPIGKSLRVGEISFTIVGVFRERVGTFGLSEIQRYTVLVPFSLMQYYTGDDAVEILYAQADGPEDVVLVTSQVQDLLRSRHSRTATYVVQNLSAILDAARRIGTALTVVLLVIGFIALMVSGIGIMNIMLVTVTERTREIGIRKAIGARRIEILFQYGSRPARSAGGAFQSTRERLARQSGFDTRGRTGERNALFLPRSCGRLCAHRRSAGGYSGSARIKGASLYR